jgi:hypothetical protein
MLGEIVHVQGDAQCGETREFEGAFLGAFRQDHVIASPLSRDATRLLATLLGYRINSTQQYQPKHSKHVSLGC